ncbi:MAG TPA: TatD family hydrolase [Candidatus Sulfotelmatobacter sp.]|nr:TatD family hydrolase [Candidatus Sulfotelmatobacter sp.]
MFVDSHAHLDGERFDSDREMVIARAREAGLSAMVAIGNGDGPAEADCGIRLAEKYDFIYATLGIHPHEARLADDAAYANMERLARHPKVIAWGEIGLDYFYDHSLREVQKEVFTRQMELAAAAKLPIVIHCRPSEGSDNAWEDCLGLIQERWAPKGIGGILHCFTGNWPQAKRALDIGFMISFAGNITFPKAQQIRDAALEVPLDRMLIETDSPYLAPVPHRGKRNEPAFVKDTARKLGELRGLPMEEVGERTSRNFYNFFKIAETAESKVTAR